MTEALLALIALAVIGERAYNNYLDRKERKTLLHFKVAQNATELQQLELAANTEIKVKPEAEPDLIPENMASPEMWDKAIKKQQEEEDSAHS